LQENIMGRGSGQDTGIVRAKNTGTFDRTVKTWRIKGRGIQASVRQLSKRYGVTFKGDTPAQLEKETTPYWRRYLQDIADDHRQARKAASPLQDRIKSIEAMIARLKLDKRPTAILERMLADAINTPAHDIDAADIPVLHPDAEQVARLLPLDPDALTVGLLNNLIPTPIRTPAKDSLRHEADIFIDRHKAKKHKGWYQVRQVVNMFLDITGDISIHEVNINHYREMNKQVKEHESWGETSQSRHWTNFRLFLKRIEADHGTNYHFLRNPDYNIQTPEGRKEQYTVEQVKLALRHATGDVRMGLLLGLNTGSYWGDIIRFTADNLADGHLSYIRAKNRHKNIKVKGSYLLWPDTLACLTYGHRQWKLAEQYTTFRLQYGLPEHKALRKTTAQLIHDEVGETEARLYRGENVAGTHGKSYIVPFTPAQIEKLDNALRVVGAIYGLLPG